MAKIVKLFSDYDVDRVQRRIDKYVEETSYIPLQVSISVATVMTDTSHYTPQERHTVAIIFETDISIEM